MSAFRLPTGRLMFARCRPSNGLVVCNVRVRNNEYTWYVYVGIHICVSVYTRVCVLCVCVRVYILDTNMYTYAVDLLDHHKNQRQ